MGAIEDGRVADAAAPGAATGSVTSASGAGEEIGERTELIGLRLREETIRGGLDHRIGIPDGHDGAREYAHLDRLWMPIAIDVGGLIGDVQINVDDLAGDCRPRGQERNFFGLSRATINQRPPADPADHTDRPRFDIAQERRHDYGDDD